LSAWDGDHLITPFQCDLCVFCTLIKCNPTPQDSLLSSCIHQVNLDALWGQEAATVQANRQAIRQALRMWQRVRVPPHLPALGPHPLEDTFGYSIAIAMILKSRDKGRYAPHQQFETIHKLWSGFSNIYMSSLIGSTNFHTVGGDSAKHYLSQCPTHSLWFERFSRGCLSRIGQEVRQDMAISVPVIHELLHHLKMDCDAAADMEARCDIITLGTYISIAFCGSFCGSDLRSYLQAPADPCLPPHVIIPLLGRSKNEIDSRYHLTPLAAVTSSGINVHLWVSQTVALRDHDGHHHGPAFCNAQGKPLSSTDIKLDFLDHLQRVQDLHPTLIPVNILVHDSYGLSRSFRRGATSEARARVVSPDDIDLINHWRSFKHARGRRPRLAMRDHYSDIRLLIPALLRFSQAF
jgi:hypothetical protein